MRKKDSVTHSMYDTPVSHKTDSDDLDSEEMLPMGAFLVHTGGGGMDSGEKIIRKPTRC